MTEPLDRSQKIFSFDIFDTVLTRTVACPQDLFVLLQDSLLTDPSIHLPEHFLSDFARIRRQAPWKAMRLLHKEDVSLQMIYDHIAHEHKIPANITLQLRQAELCLEAALMRPIEPVCANVRHLIRTGERVIFISDMYLPKTFIHAQLTRFMMDVRPEDIFLSGETGRRKITGRLFIHILKELNIHPVQVHHFGDNSISDVMIPRLLGLSVANLADEYYCREISRD